MKKFRFLILGIFCILLVGCGSNKKDGEASVTDRFEEVTTKNEFIFLDNIGSYPDNDDINEAKKAILNDMVVEIIVYKDNKSAKKAQNKQIEDFKANKDESAKENEKEKKNSYKYWVVSSGYYMISSRKDNTLVFCKTASGNQEKVEKLLSDLKY